jgi:hypothetical protein
MVFHFEELDNDIRENNLIAELLKKKEKSMKMPFSTNNDIYCVSTNNNIYCDRLIKIHINELELLDYDSKITLYFADMLRKKFDTIDKNNINKKLFRQWN